MGERGRLLESIANTIKDYRAGEIEQPTPEHVERWVMQFEAETRLPLLRELDHVLRTTYLNRDWVCGWLSKLVTVKKLAGDDPCSFWARANFLSIQEHGHSQEEMLEVFTEILSAQCGIAIDDCGNREGDSIYLDDGLFSGSRVGNDISSWIAQEAPDQGTLQILVIACHTLGAWQVDKRLNDEAKKAGKNIKFTLWRAISFENRLSSRNNSEVLWPAVLPDDAGLEAYMEQENKFPFKPRTPGGKGEHNVFSSEEGRQLLERELLLAGIRIREFCQSPRRAMRPLGFSAFGLGFGSMLVTFRNCPNNCPLALWWGDPEAPGNSPLSEWYPLLPRKTYGQRID